MSARPRVRALVVDARGDPTPTLVGRLRALGVGTVHAPSPGPDKSVLTEAARHEVLFESCPVGAAAQIVVDAARGVDAVVIVSGRATFRAANALRILHACGCRRAVALMTEPKQRGSSDLVENLTRHLLLDTGFPADDSPTVTLPDGVAAMSTDDAARLLEVVDGIVTPRQAGHFVIIDGRVTEGAVAAGAVDAWALGERDVLRPIVLDVRAPAAAGDVVDLGEAPRRGVLISDAAYVVDRRARLVHEVPHSPWGAIACMAFGGRGGFADASVSGHSISVSRGAIVPVDGRIGLVRIGGDGQWRSLSLAFETPPGADEDTPPDGTERPDPGRSSG